MEFRHKFVGVMMLVAIALVGGCIGWDQEGQSTSLTTAPSTVVTTTVAQTTVPEGYPQAVEVGKVPSDEALAEWEEFKEKYGDFRDMRWNSYRDSPERISGKPIKITNVNVSTSEIAEQAVMNFIKENKELLNVKTEDLELNRLMGPSNDKEWGVEYIQTYNGIPVHQGIVRMSILTNGKMGTLTNQFYPNINVTTTPKLTKEEAIEKAKDELRRRFNLGDSPLFREEEQTEKAMKLTTLVIFPDKGGSTINYYLTWKVCCLIDQTIFVDAVTGEIVYSYNNLKSATFRIQGNVTGETYPEKPTDTLSDERFQNQYIYVMDNDTTPPQQMRNVTTDSNGHYDSGNLDGTNADVYIEADIEGPYVLVLNNVNDQDILQQLKYYGSMSGNYTHNFSWSISREANVYYHATRAYEYFAGSSFNYTMDLNTSTYNPDGRTRMYAYANTSASEAGSCMYLARTDGYNIYFTDISYEEGTAPCSFESQLSYPAAYSSDTILHEYTHCVVYHLYGNDWIAPDPSCDNGSNTTKWEGCMMDEGIADYFGCTINNNSNSEDPIDDRNLSNTKNYASMERDYIDDDSLVFSGALWDLREDVGQGVADRLVFEAMEKDNPRIIEAFFTELLEEDDTFYGNTNISDGTPHSAYIHNSFFKHGMDYDPYMITLPDDYPIRAGLLPYLNESDDYYKFNVTSTEFAAIGIKPLSTPIHDYDVYVYSDINMQNEVNHSIYEANNIDFVVVNGHTVGSAVYYADIYAGGDHFYGPYKVEAEFDVPTLSNGTASYSMTGDEVFDLYEVYLYAGTMCKINVTPVYALDVGAYLLNDTGGRDFAKADSDRFRRGVRETIAFKPSKDGYYAVVVTNENGASGEYNISFSSVSENCGPNSCTDASTTTGLETTQICDLTNTNAWYNITAGNDDIGVFLEVPATGDYDLATYKSSCGGNPESSSDNSGDGIDENCSINVAASGTHYYIKINKSSGTGTFQVHIGNDSNTDSYPDFMNPCNSNADEDNDGIVEDFELLFYIDDWADGIVDDFELLNAIDQWARGSEGCLKGRPSTKEIASGTRILKAGAIQAGSTYDANITLTVNESYGLNSITVTEQIPAGWNLTNSSPTADSFNISTGIIKWNLRTSNVTDMVINYTVFIPADETSNRTVSGNTKYIDEGSNVLIETTGNSSVIVNRTCATGINPPASGEWKIDQATECEDADICLSSGSDLNIHNKTLILEDTEAHVRDINFIDGGEIVLSGNTTIYMS